MPKEPAPEQEYHAGDRVVKDDWRRGKKNGTVMGVVYWEANPQYIIHWNGGTIEHCWPEEFDRA